ncbi:hypothetical protein HKX48_006311 [Thoreauomyces humboldtii]|nr:hypothetical protein HKX48_006311 [Thoreauomyces humboldtii]
MFGKLLLTLAKKAWWSFAACAFAFICWCVSSSIILYEEFTVQPDPVLCLQSLSTSLTSANNALFLIGFASLTLPIIVILIQHMRNAKKSRTGSSSGVRRVYSLQIGFLFLFTVTYLLVSIGGWFWTDLYSVLYGFIWSDYVYLLGIYMWLLPEAGAGSNSGTRLGTQSVAVGQAQRKSLLPAGSGQPAVKRTAEETADEIA